MTKKQKPAKEPDRRRGLRARAREGSEVDAGPRPVWAPQGADLEMVPDEVRQAIVEVIEPVYERFVRGTDDPLEMTLGVTVAHLLWLEVLQQFDMKREYLEVSAVLGLPEDRGPVIEQHLRIIYSKVKVGYLLARLRELRQQWQERTRAILPEPPEPADSPYWPAMFDPPPDGVATRSVGVCLPNTPTQATPCPEGESMPTQARACHPEAGPNGARDHHSGSP
ncbi:MAG: hypothetical protein ABIP48_15395 [Planctomycetota bacterium]